MKDKNGIKVEYYGVWNRDVQGGEGLVIINFDRRDLPYNLHLQFNDHIDSVDGGGADVKVDGENVDVIIDHENTSPIFLKPLISHGTTIDNLGLESWNFEVKA